jgi:hypothetical protein
MEKLNIEIKEDSPEKLAAIAGKPTKNFLMAQEFNDVVAAINELASPDIVLKTAAIEINGLDISALADGFEWRIDQVVFDDTPALAETLNPATDGFYRKDALLGTNTNSYLIFEGTEGDESVSPPSVFPDGTILLGIIDVFGDTATEFVISDTSVVYLAGNGGATDYLEVNGLGTTLVIFNATSLTGFTIPSENIQFGKDYYLRNSTGAPLTLKNLTGTNSVRHYFPEGDLIVPVNNNVHLKYLSNNSFGGLGYFTLANINYKGKADTTYVDAQDSLKENTANKSSAISGQEASNSFFPTNNGITGWIKNFMPSWLTSKATTLVDADSILVVDSEDGFKTKTRTIAQFKAMLLAYLSAYFATKTIEVVKISGTKTLSDTDNGLVFILTASCVVTIPNGLIAGFNATFRTLTGATYSQSLGTSVTMIGNEGVTMLEKSSFTMVQTATTNEYLITGAL